MIRFVGSDVSQKLTSICVVDETGRRLWRGQCSTDPDQLAWIITGHAGEDPRIGLESGSMAPWLVHALRERGLEIVCLDARHASAALKMRIPVILTLDPSDPVILSTWRAMPEQGDGGHGVRPQCDDTDRFGSLTRLPCRSRLFLAGNLISSQAAAL